MSLLPNTGGSIIFSGYKPHVKFYRVGKNSMLIGIELEGMNFIISDSNYKQIEKKKKIC